MVIGIVGLGLIGGSFAKAIKENTDHTVYGMDIVQSVVLKALMLKAVDISMTDENIKDCDLVIVALYPKDTLDFIRANAPKMKAGAIIMDCCGVKEVVVSDAEKIASEYGLCFIGGHPMAGIEYSGFEYSKKALFHNASMILTPTPNTGIFALEKIKKLCLQLGFGFIQISTPRNHDRMIALTSQLAHIISSAYVQSESALEHRGFSAGSFKDMTRVARLNENMWTELFIDNSDYLCDEIDGLITRLSSYRNAIKSRDAGSLKKLLKSGSDRKKFLDGEDISL